MSKGEVEHEPFLGVYGHRRCRSAAREEEYVMSPEDLSAEYVDDVGLEEDDQKPSEEELASTKNEQIP